MPTASPTQSPYTPCASCSPPPLHHGQVKIPNHYQRPDGTGGSLNWEVFPPAPTPPPGTKPPGIVLVHGSGWNAGDSSQINGRARDLAGAGYYVVSVNYELAPCGLITDQQCHDDDLVMPGWWVNREVQDVEAFVTALRDSGQVDKDQIGIVGGSAGATLALLVVLDTADTHGVWPFWNASVRPACAVLLSGAYDFSNRVPSEGQSEMDSRTIGVFENFTQSGLPSEQKDVSPVSKVLTPTQGMPFVPLFMIHSQYDPTVPYHQLVEMLCTLQDKSVPASLYQTLYLPGSNLHSFHYWGSCDNPLEAGPSCTLVSADVISYLDAHLK